jgi:hypothetical protein
MQCPFSIKIWTAHPFVKVNSMFEAEAGDRPTSTRRPTTFAPRDRSGRRRRTFECGGHVPSLGDQGAE